MDERDTNRDTNRAAGEELEKLTRESYRAAVEQAFDAQKSGMRLSRRFFEKWVETLEDHAELNRRTVEGLAEQLREQREVFREMSRESLEAYDNFAESLYFYQQQLDSDKGDDTSEGRNDRDEGVSEHTVWRGTGGAHTRST